MIAHDCVVSGTTKPHTDPNGAEIPARDSAKMEADLEEGGRPQRNTIGHAGVRPPSALTMESGCASSPSGRTSSTSTAVAAFHAAGVELNYKDQVRDGEEQRVKTPVVAAVPVFDEPETVFAEALEDTRLPMTISNNAKNTVQSGVYHRTRDTSLHESQDPTSSAESDDTPRTPSEAAGSNDRTCQTTDRKHMIWALALVAVVVAVAVAITLTVVFTSQNLQPSPSTMTTTSTASPSATQIVPEPLTAAPFPSPTNVPTFQPTIAIEPLFCDGAINLGLGVCCNASCEQCGGAGCSAGGRADDCCLSNILENNVSCGVTRSGPCVIPCDGLFDLATSVCCSASCAQCGGPGCSAGGRADVCCTSNILEINVSCDDVSGIGPCVIAS